MTNILENTKQSNVRMHIIKAFDVINKHLPEMYVSKVLEKLPENTKISSSTIRNVRNQKGGKNVGENHIEIINALVEVANDNKIAKENLEKLIT